MNSLFKNLAFCAFLGASGSAYASPVLMPNGDFATPGGTSWHEVGAGTTFSYPTTGGNPDGYGVMTEPGGGWGIWVGNADAAIPLASLGLTAGQTYVFSQDMKIFSGTNIGGFKIDFVPSGSTGDKRIATIGDGTTWETYNYTIAIPAGTTGIKIVPLWGPGSSVGFDNFRVENGAVAPPPLTPGIPNPGFETPGGVGWAQVSGGITYSYPASGGNPNGYGVMNASNGQWAIWVSNGDSALTLEQLSLTAGGTYHFTQDMKILSGANVGGLKIDFVPSGSTGDMRIAKIGDGTTWATYSYPVTIPAGTTGLKIVPLWGANSSVAYDNFKVTPPPPPAPLQASIAPATKLNWAAASAVNGYQPQKSADNVVWTNVGPNLVGNTVTSTFDGGAAPYYRVLESIPGVQEAIINGGFEANDGFDEFTADGWDPAQTQPATRILTGARTGLACMQLKVLNAASEPNGAETHQNTFNAGGSISTGSTYTLSFWAKQISSGPSYVQQYRVSWLADGGAEVIAGAWQDFSASVGGSWEQKTLSGLVAPVGATTAFIQIVGKTGAVAGGLGEVLIDDVSLAATGFGTPTVIAASTAPALKVSWQSITALQYQVQTSSDLGTWSNAGGVIVGDGSLIEVYDSMVDPAKFYRVAKLP